MSSYENSKLALQKVKLNNSLSTSQIVNTTDGFTLFDQYNFEDTMDVEATSTLNNKTAKYLIGVAKIVGDTNYLHNLDANDPDRRFYVGYNKLQEYLEDVTKAMLIALLDGNAKRTTSLSSDTLQEKRQVFLNALNKEQYKDQNIKPWNNWRDTHSTVNISSVSKTGGVVTVTTSAPHGLDTSYDDWGVVVSINNSDFDINTTDYPNGVPIILTGADTFTYKKSGSDVASTSVTGTGDIKIGWGGDSNNLHIHFS
tara:strand:+ start:1826 stop:2590 length:765 start_codon:yes stop_codon:yes gene_type:complete